MKYRPKPLVWGWRRRTAFGVRFAHPFADRFGDRVRVLARGAMNSALIEFDDGLRAVVSKNALRRK